MENSFITLVPGRCKPHRCKAERQKGELSDLIFQQNQNHTYLQNVLVHYLNLISF